MWQSKGVACWYCVFFCTRLTVPGIRRFTCLKSTCFFYSFSSQIPQVSHCSVQLSSDTFSAIILSNSLCSFSSFYCVSRKIFNRSSLSTSSSIIKISSFLYTTFSSYLAIFISFFTFYLSYFS